MHTPELPFSGNTVAARHASFMAACAASKRKGQKSRLMLQVLYPDQRLSDHKLLAAMRQIFPIAPSSIQSIRANLIELALVEDSGDTEPSPFVTTRNVQVVRWQLTAAGKQAVEAMRELK